MKVREIRGFFKANVKNLPFPKTNKYIKGQIYRSDFLNSMKL